MRSIIIALFATALASEGTCAEKIGGIMGLTLGRKFYPPSAKSACKLLEKRNEKNEHTVVYIYELPKRGILGMHTVNVEVTPKTGIICQITARTRRNEFQTLDKAQVNLDLIISKLEKKYGKAVDAHIDQGNRVITWATFDISTDPDLKGQQGAMIYISCFDKDLSGKAAEEREEINGETNIFEYF